MGFCWVEVVPSPKSQNQLIAPIEESLKAKSFLLLQLVVYPKSAMGGFTRI